MKSKVLIGNRLILQSAAFFLLLLNASAWAGSANNPCEPVKKACIAAGYFPASGLAGHNLWKDCLMPLKQGQHLSNVQVTPADISACNAFKEKSTTRIPPVFPSDSRPVAPLVPKSQQNLH